MPVPVETAFAWHARPGALARLTPPWEKVECLRNDLSIRDGARVSLRVPLMGPIKKNWEVEHAGYQENVQFVDRQVSGPFAFYEHTHRFVSVSPDRSCLIDHIEFKPPLGALGKLGLRLIRQRLDRAFTYRHQILKNDLERHAAFQNRPRLRIAITGSTGLVGSQLVPFLLTGGHQVVRLVRSLPNNPVPDGTTSILWNPAQGQLDADSLDGVDAVINLAGAGIADKRWSPQRKKEILDSRVTGTTLLAQTLSKLKKPPGVFFSASAIGYYPSSAETVLTESHPAGTGFLPEVCQAWEAAATPATQAGIRTVLGRIGIVLSGKGGALSAQVPLFRWCIGGRLGSGRQYMPWITIDDLIYAIHFCLMRDTMQGAVNLTAPSPVTNQVFTKTLGRVLHRPTLLPAPAFALRLALGEMADGLLLSSMNVIPEKLQLNNFEFSFPELEPALQHQLAA